MSYLQKKNDLNHNASSASTKKAKLDSKSEFPREVRCSVKLLKTETIFFQYRFLTMCNISDRRLKITLG